MRQGTPIVSKEALEIRLWSAELAYNNDNNIVIGRPQENELVNGTRAARDVTVGAYERSGGPCYSQSPVWGNEAMAIR